MQQLNIYAAKTNLSQLVEQAHQGNSFIITKSGKPLAKLIPFKSKDGNCFQFGTLRNKIKIFDDFDTLSSDNLLDLFEAD